MNEEPPWGKAVGSPGEHRRRAAADGIREPSRVSATHEPGVELPPMPPTPPAADVPGALARTEHALGEMADADRFETIAVACLEEYVPALRNTGGPGDEQRDGVGGAITASGGNELALTVSLQRTWAAKVVSDLDGLDEHGEKPKLVIAATNRKTGAKRRNELIREARDVRGYTLEIIDVRFLALRLLSPGLLDIRQELLGLAPPSFPVAVSAGEFARRQPDLGAPKELIGRAEEVDELARLAEANTTVEVIGPGGIGKTRLLLAATARIDSDRTLFIDDRALLDGDLLASELAGADRLTLVVDNAHRRENLRSLIGLLASRHGPTRLMLIARPGYVERLRQATEGSPFGVPGAIGRLTVGPIPNKQIGDLLRSAQPKLEFKGAIEQIVAVAACNPLIALLAHRAASSRGGLHGLAFTDILSDYARSGIATAVERRDDVHADDMEDLLAVVAALGAVGPAEEPLIAALLGTPVRTVRHRIEDLADGGLLTPSGGEQMAISPDLLAAHIVQQTHLSAGASSGVRYEEIWQAADEARRDVMCSVLGSLNGFDVSQGARVSAFLTDTLVEFAKVDPCHALRRAQALAPGLPDVAVRVVDVAVAALPDDPDIRERALLTAMDALSCVTDITEGWPRQLTIAQIYFASEGSAAATKRVNEMLTSAYKRLPLEMSSYDGYVLAHVQGVLTEGVVTHWNTHRGEPGCAQALAVAAGQLLTLVSERTGTSAEDRMVVQLRAAFLPAGARTEAALQAGTSILIESLAELELDRQLEAVKPLVGLHRTARGAVGPFGAQPSTELVALAAAMLEETVTRLSGSDELPLPTRAALVDALDTNPWPESKELQDFLELLTFSSIAERIGDEGERADRQAESLLDSEDLPGALEHWQAWLSVAEEARMKHAASMVIPRALIRCAENEPDRLATVLEAILETAGALTAYTSGALAVLVNQPGGRELMQRLAAHPDAGVRAAVARGLSGTADGWADELLEKLAGEDSELVRSGVVTAAGWTHGGSSQRVTSGLRACLPSNVDLAVTLLGRLQHRRGAGETPVVNEQATALVEEIATNAARAQRLDGYSLAELGKLGRLPRLVIETCIHRVQWLAQSPVESVGELLARDGVPDELADAARSGAEDRDRLTLMGLIESTPADNQARGEATKLLTWIDDHETVTGRICQWLSDGDEALRYPAFELLRLTRDAEAFKQRARAILAVSATPETGQLILEGREPTWLSGSERAIYRQILDELREWTDDEDDTLAAVGRLGMQRFAERAEDAEGAEVDETAEWG